MCRRCAAELVVQLDTEPLIRAAHESGAEALKVLLILAQFGDARGPELCAFYAEHEPHGCDPVLRCSECAGGRP